MRIEFYGVLAEAAGTATLELPGAPATVAEALAQLGAARPQLAAHLQRSACAIGDRLVKRDEPLPAGATLVLLPPVSGG